MKSTYVKIGFLLMFLGIVAAGGSALSSGSSYNRIANAAIIKPLDDQSSVSEVLDFAENSKNHWQTIFVAGHSGANGNFAPFRTWVEKPSKYRSEEGENVVVKDNLKQMVLWLKPKKAKEFTAPPVPEDVKARLDADMEVHRAEDPTLAREGELVVDTPVNDLINPSYFVRKELRFAAKTVEKVGLTSIAGRKAIQLKVAFPKELAKEDYWDVFVDTETGIVLGLVVHPLPGNPKFETFIDELKINPVVDANKFDLSVPGGYAVEK